MPGACRATGRGLQPSGLRVKQVGDFKVDTRTAGSGDLKAVVKGPSKYSSSFIQTQSETGTSDPEVGKHHLKSQRLMGAVVCVVLVA